MTGEAGPGEVGAPFVVRGKIVAVGPNAELEVKGPATIGGATTLTGDLTHAGRILSDEHNAFSPADLGLLSWNFDPAMATGITTPVGGVVHIAKLLLRRTTVISNILWGIATAGGTASAGQNEVGLYSSGGVRLAATNVDSVIAATGLKTTALASPVKVDAGFVWAAFVFNVSAGNVPSPARCANGVSSAFMNAGLTAATARWATVAVGQTTLPASFTPASSTFNSNTFWFGLS